MLFRSFPGAAEQRQYQKLARQLIAAGARHATLTGGSPRVDMEELRRIVRSELPADESDAAQRPMSTCPDHRVVEAAAEVRSRGRIWAATSAPGRNAAAWIALNCLAEVQRPSRNRPWSETGTATTVAEATRDIHQHPDNEPVEGLLGC